MNSKVLSLTAAMTLSLSALAASVETDRPWYLAGEAMTVSVTADDALIAYAELCDTRGLAAGTVVGLSEGEGTGVIELPSSLHSGYYVLSVYTRHDPSVSHRLVAVVNPLRKSEDDDIRWEAITHPDSLSYPQAVGTLRDGASRPASGDGLFTADLTDRKDVEERETDGHIIKARVRNDEGHTYTGNQIIPSLSIVGKQIHYFEGKMVDDSTAVFHTFGLHGKLPLVLSARSYDGENLPIEIISPFASLLPKRLPHLVFHYRRSEVEARSLDMQRHQIAIAPAKREQQLGDDTDETAEDGVPLDYDDTVFGIKPYLTYNLDEYRQFLTIREVLIEYVICVSHRKSNGQSQLFVHTEDIPSVGALPSLVLIDGMPVSDIDRLLSYDARRIHHINIYSDQFTFGNGVYNGILSFITRSGRLTNYPTERNAQYVVYQFPE